MAGTFRDGRSPSVELGHQYVGGDGAAAVDSLLEGFRRRHRAIDVEGTRYDNLRLQVKSRILKGDPPEAWIGWPGGELRGYVDAGVAGDVTDLWEETDLADAIRPFAAESCRVDGSYYAVPITIHRVNDLYVHTARCEEVGLDPSAASGPADLVEALRSVAGETDAAPVLVPMSDPFAVLQLWEVTLLGLHGATTFERVAGGDAAAHRDAVRSALSTVADLASVAPDGSLYDSLTDANEAFRDGGGLVYPQGDWAGGAFVEADGFEYGVDWDRVPFPGTEDAYVLVQDAVVPSADAEGEGVDAFLEHAGSAGAQAEFNRLKGSLPPRADAPMDAFTEFGRDQERLLERSRHQPKTVAHGLSVTPAQLVDLKSAVAEFVDSWDVDGTADEMVRILAE